MDHMAESMDTKPKNNGGLNLPYRLISGCRPELMGIGILCVIIFHSRFTTDNTILKLIKDLGYGGVDVFLFLSGMGVYNSLEKNSPGGYFKNRLNRIVPVWWSFLIIWTLVGALFCHEVISLRDFAGFAAFTGLWLGMEDQGNWYVYAIMLFYLFAPVLHSVISGSSKKKRTTAIMILISLLVSFTFFGTDILIAFSRVPVFILGMGFTAAAGEGFSRTGWWTTAVLGVLGFVTLICCYFLCPDKLWPYGLWWYPLMPVSFALPLAEAAIINRLPAMPVRKVLSCMGGASLEILMMSDLFVRYFKKTIVSENVTALLIILVVIPMGILYHRVIEEIKKVIKKRYSRRADL